MSHALRRFLHVKHPERVRVTFLLFLAVLPEGVPFSTGLWRCRSETELDM